MFKFEIGDIVSLKDNYIELWESNNRRKPLNMVIEHFNSLIGKKLLILNRDKMGSTNIYNIDGFVMEEYILQKERDRL